MAWSDWLESDAYKDYVANTETAKSDWENSTNPTPSYIDVVPSDTRGDGTSPAPSYVPVVQSDTKGNDPTLLASLAKLFGYDTSQSLLDNLPNLLKNRATWGITGALLAGLTKDRGAIGGSNAPAWQRPSHVPKATVNQGRYGPYMTYEQPTYAADGGLMHAYKDGGTVAMEDGGFVMTKRAVDGAGGPQGIRRLVPGARMIGGPPDPTGRKDLTPAYIQGPHGRAPAAVSRGEAYVPKRHVDANGGPDRMHQMMKALERSKR